MVGSSQKIVPVKHNIYDRQISMPPAGFEPAIAASERLQSHALDGAATEVGGTVELGKITNRNVP